LLLDYATMWYITNAYSINAVLFNMPNRFQGQFFNSARVKTPEFWDV